MDSLTTIGLLCDGWTPDAGGVETHPEGLARALMAAGLRVAVLATESDARRPAHAIRDTTVEGVFVRRMNRPPGAPTSIDAFLRDPGAEAAVRSWMTTAKPDVVHVHQLSGFGFGALAVLDRPDVSLVMTLHDYHGLCPRRQMLHVDGTACAAPVAARCAPCIGETWLRLAPSAAEVARRTSRDLSLLRRVDSLLVPSEAARDVWVRAGLERERMTVCEPGIESQILRASTQLARADLATGKRLGVLGPVHPSKGVLELARAVRTADVHGLSLEIHGPLGGYHGDATAANALRALADRDARIRLHGRYERRDLPRVLATLDAVAAPARWNEAYGLSAREARAVGLPVLASRRGALAELDGDAGVTLVDGDDLASWVSALRDFAFTRTEPARAHGLLTMTEHVLGVYHQARRRRAAAGPRVNPRAGRRVR